MRHIDFDPSTLNGVQRDFWDRWLEKAKKAADEYEDAVSKRKEGDDDPSFNTGVWSELKKWLLENVFNGKCAYCEVKITDGFFGHAEHYRPKGAVITKTEGKAVRVTQADGRQHQGYYWLAYDWPNLLPSCELCNNAKLNQFPIIGKRVFNPHGGPDTATLDEIERPLLVNPYRDQPEKHLKFGVNGIISHKTQKGKNSIDVYNLDREKLTEFRGEQQRYARTKFAMAALNYVENDTSFEDAMREFTAKEARFSAAVADYLLEVGSGLIEKIKSATNLSDHSLCS